MVRLKYRGLKNTKGIQLAGRATRLWLPLHLITLVALLLQPSTGGTILGRYSTTAAALIGLLALTAPLVGWLAPKFADTFKRWGLLAAEHWTLTIAVGVLVLVLWALPVASAPAYSVLKLYITGLAVTFGLWSLETLPPAEDLRWWVMLAPVLVPGLVLVTIAGLFVVVLGFPGVRFVDEAYMTSLAWNFGNTGSISPLIYDPVATESYALMYMGLGVWYRLVGVGLWTGRAFIYLVGLAALAVTWAVARRHYGPYGGWIAVLVGAFALVPLNLLRQDVSVALYLALALLAYTVAQDRQWPAYHFVVGFMVAFATDGHPNAYRFSLAFGAAYLLEWVLLWRNQGRLFYWPLLYLLIGGVAGVASYVGLYAWLGDSFLNLASSPVLEPTAPPHLVFLDQITVAIQQTPLLFGVALLGLIAGIWQNQPLTRLIAVVLLVNMIVLAILFGYYRAYYVAQSVGLYALLVAALFGALPQDAAARVRVGLALFVLAANVGLLINRYSNTDLREGFNPALTVGADLREIIPADTTIVATDPMYYGLIDHVRFVEYAAGGWAAGKFGVTEASVWDDVAPDYVVVFYDNPIPLPGALQAHMGAVGMVLVDCWRSERLGQIDLYTLPNLTSNPTEPANCKDIR